MLFCLFPAFLSCLLLLCCTEKKEVVRFPVKGTSVQLFAKSAEAAEGFIDFSHPQKLEYFFEFDPALPALASLEIEYDFSLPPSGFIKENYQLAIEAGGLWALPLDLSFLGRGSGIIHYAIPVESVFSLGFSFALLPENDAAKRKLSKQKGELSRFQIRSLEIKERWFGCYGGTSDTSGEIFVTPFVFKRDDGRFVIDPPQSASFTHNGIKAPELLVALNQKQGAFIETLNRRYEILPNAGIVRFSPPAAGLPVFISAAGVPGFQIDYTDPPPFPLPIEADPGLVLEWQNWRNETFEVFRWPLFPAILIFDTADYAVQNRMLKRLAFFVEKAGFKGRLAPDEEIAGFHGWNAHDYRAEDLAGFFEAARKINFPLHEEERQLERILLDQGILRRENSGAIAAGEGAFISISRESASYLRSLFMVHEAFHGIFFIDEDFRAFSRRRWDGLDPLAKRFMLSYFDYQHYDIKDDYLIINEFMAHILQQPVSLAARYFGETLPSRLESSAWRRSALPEKDAASHSWPALAAAFTAEAEAFSVYVNRRWNLSAGRVYSVALRP